MLGRALGFPLLVALLATAACGQTSASHPLAGEELRLIKEQFQGRTATVKLATPVLVAAGSGPAQPRLAFSGKTYLEERMVRVVQSQRYQQRFPLGQVAELNGSQAGTGAVLGAFAGVVAGALLALTLTGNCGDTAKPDDCLSDDDMRSLGTLFFAPVGALVGALVGAYAGSGPSWQFTPAPAAATKSEQ